MSMRVPGRRRVRQAGRWLRSRLNPRVVILGYHRVSDGTSDPFNLSVTPSELDQHLGFLARNARPVGLQHAVQELAQGTTVPRTVVVTFDDGYEDTLTMALPLLAKHDVPATLFITTGNAGAPFWWDALAACVLGAPRLADPVALEVDGHVHRFATADRTHVLQQLAALLRPLEATERNAVLAKVVQQSEGLGLTSSPRALRAEEIARLAAAPLIEIGAHTETHPVLAELPMERQRAEILNNRQTLEAVTGKPIRSFSYPNGSFTRMTQELVRDCGFTAACSSVADVASPTSDLLALPRLWVDGDRKQRFAAWIKRWLG